MDFELNSDQRAILEAVERLLEQQAGPARAIQLFAEQGYDRALEQAIQEAGFASIMTDMAETLNNSSQQLAGLEACLILEAITRHAGLYASASQMLLQPLLKQHDINIEGAIAVTHLSETNKANQPKLIRYSAHANHVLIFADADLDCTNNSSTNNGSTNNTARLVNLRKDQNSSDSVCEAAASNFGYPFGKLDIAKLSAEAADQQTLSPELASLLQDWWRLGLGIEAQACMDAALQNTLEYLKQRRQFGQSISSFQAIQHRLALCAIDVEASRWLNRETSFVISQPTIEPEKRREMVATAAAFSLNAAGKIFSEMHQMSGAIGFTREFNLHVWTMRLQALRQELGGSSNHRRTLVQARWS